MATTVQQVTITIPMNEFDLLTELAKKFKWSVTLPKRTAKTTATFEKSMQDLREGKIHILKNTKNPIEEILS
ncbi:MAG: hypothetical protein LBU90_03755 [Bacteroidales bacterium]|nr:hypothetical protein [Bacteroidales bacterium]